MRPVVKICGVRRAEDAARAAELGADLIGCVLADGSPRRATLDEVREVAAAVDGVAEVVLVFRAARTSQVVAACRATGVRRAQVHGARPELCDALERQGLVVHRVHSVRAGAAALPRLVPAPSAERPALLDVAHGGSGQRFDWRAFGGAAPAFTFVAGGITPQNVAELLVHRPWGIDLSSGVESAPGVKDGGALARLFDNLEVRG